MKLVKFIEIQAIMHCVTGLRIGSSKDTIEIGGQDNPIVRHPITNEPYVPGSSVKGKLRSLLENVYGRKETKNGEVIPKSNGEPCSCGHRDCLVCRVFGAHKNTNHKLGPTRLLVRDVVFTEEARTWLETAREEKGVNMSEVKSENMVNRINGTAGNPRPVERVPAGTRFAVEMMLKVYEGDDEQRMLEVLRQGMRLLENDYLGASGSRGYGKVRFEEIQIIEHHVDEKISLEPEREYERSR